jgi:hypothetical protein
MSPQEKRTTTQPGLGKAADERRTTTSEREAQKPRVDAQKATQERRRETKGGHPQADRSTARGIAPPDQRSERSEPRTPKSQPPKRISRPKGVRSSIARHETPAPLSAPKTDTRRRSLADRPAVSVDHVGAVSGRASNPQILTGKAVPRIIRSRAEIAEAPIDHRAGFLLAYIDGTTTVQGLIDIDVMPESEIHVILDRLRRLGIVAIR